MIIKFKFVATGEKFKLHGRDFTKVGRNTLNGECGIGGFIDEETDVEVESTVKTMEEEPVKPWVRVWPKQRRGRVRLVLNECRFDDGK